MDKLENLETCKINRSELIVKAGRNNWNTVSKRIILAKRLNWFITHFTGNFIAKSGH